MWVLFWIIIGSAGISSGSAEMDSQVSCENAARKLTMTVHVNHGGEISVLCTPR